MKEDLTNRKKQNDMIQLTEQEEEIMRLVWSVKEPFTVRDVLWKLPTPQPPYTTLASIVKNIESKGYLSSVLNGKTREYKVLISRNQYMKASIRRLVQNYFQGSYSNLVQQFAQEEYLSPKELQELIDLIEEGKK
ncbi:putative transcriptional regulator [Porphyromonas crevioricanis JCM 15906]|nr:putative transcriptional regulator [Porphyromonas crevioricanis JCM 15906]GAD07504.1 putative transcriptional regulator [Porphyromonas crevioricanis JCM 13913]